MVRLNFVAAILFIFARLKLNKEPLIKNKMKKLIFISIVLFASCVSQKPSDEIKLEIRSNQEAKGFPITIQVKKGATFNHPTFAIWVEDLDGNYIETLFVTKSIATGIFGHGEITPGKWSNVPGAIRRPAALPYWSHKRNIQAPDGLYTPSPETAVPDAISGATPTNSFVLKTALSKNPSGEFRILLEVNQAWDSNLFWVNNKYTNDTDYFASLQPSLVYSGTFNPENMEKPVDLAPIGHGEPSGKNGTLNADISTLTTAKEIFLSIRIEN